MDMNEHLRGKYLRKGAPSVIGYPARPRTDNTHGPVHDRLPALQPCRRAAAGAKVFTPTPQKNTGVRRVLNIEYGGKQRWGWEDSAGRPVANFKGDPILAQMGLS